MSTTGESDSDSEHAITGITGIPVAPVAGKPQKSPWFKNKYVVFGAAFFLVTGIAGVAVSLVIGMNASSSGSSSSASNAAPIGPTLSTVPPTVAPSAGPLIISFSPPTPIPTGPPTPRPSPAPSFRPSIAPTVQQTARPTARPTESTFDTFSFFVMGDIPYAPWEEAVLSEQLAEMRSSRPLGSSFVVHVGDLMKAQRTLCTEASFFNVYSLILQSPLPTLVLQGDNDSLDCPDPAQARAYFLKYFAVDPTFQGGMPFEQRWDLFGVPDDAVALDVTRWTDKRPEMFSFVTNGILFLSINLMNGYPEDVGGLPEWDSRMQDCIEWVSTNVDQAFEQQPIRGVVIFGHAERTPETRPFFEAISPLFFPRRMKIPVLYFHGDGHRFEIDTKFSDQLGWNMYRDIQVDAGAEADPLLVEVAPIVNGVMIPLEKEENSQYIFGDGLFRVDRQRGLYSA